MQKLVSVEPLRVTTTCHIVHARVAVEVGEVEFTLPGWSMRHAGTVMRISPKGELSGIWPFLIFALKKRPAMQLLLSRH